MDSIYENSNFILSTFASQCGENSTEEQKPEEKVTSPKWTKVLLIVLGFSLVIAVGGLCALWMLYVSGSVMVRELTANYTRVRERLSIFEAFTGRSLSCSMSLTIFHGKLYSFSCDKLSWSSSRAFCASKGADLVTVTSQSEQGFLISKIKEKHWIGLSDLQTEGRWVWVNNQTLKETGVQFWYERKSGKSEPDNWNEEDPTGENCASVENIGSNLKSWYDASCKKQKKFICEKVMIY